MNEIFEQRNHFFKASDDDLSAQLAEYGMTSDSIPY